MKFISGFLFFVSAFSLLRLFRMFAQIVQITFEKENYHFLTNISNMLLRLLVCPESGGVHYSVLPLMFFSCLRW